MQNILAKKSTPARRAAKRDRAQRIGEMEQLVLGVLRLAWSWAKDLWATVKEGTDSKVGQYCLIALVVGLLVGSGFVDGMVDGWLGQ